MEELFELPNAGLEKTDVELATIIGRKRKISLQSCGTCGSEEAKYRCPCCMKYSCSLSCVKKHKTDLKCTGIRDKAAFVDKTQYNDINLLSDYRFLEDVARSADCAARDIFIQRPSTNKFLNSLKKQARKRNIDLHILPAGFTKRKENSSFFHKREQKFYWCLKLVFHLSHAEYFVKRVPEDQTLHQLLKAYTDPQESDPVIRQRLKAYVRDLSAVTVFMKVEKRKHDSVRYYELDPGKSLHENLKNKTIIEYPTLHVTLKEFKKDFVVLGQGKQFNPNNTEHSDCRDKRFK
ncbi:box C/D snoRNA protein 1 isoform X2 [Pleurodeles waltl]|uniref:box C/D snoRNA protein 1 isoform X2 n=1 Tax=Pleurodeles waltl TaxID=8319 RepID=UPI00370942F1